MVDSYTNGDDVIFLREQGVDDWRVLYGKPMDQRLPDEQVPLTGVLSADFTGDDRGLLLCCAVFEDCYGPAYLDLRRPGELHPVSVIGVRHSGIGEMVRVIRLDGERYAVEYNIDGCSWLYEATYDPQKLQLHLGRVYAGEKPPLVNGVLVSWRYDPAGDRFALVFSTATSPTQIFTVECTARMRVTPHTRERVLGIAANQLSGGEDASFTSYDGTRVSARLYLPSADLGYQGARPLVYYVHGGPQGQERPDFAWFSMPLIQFLTLNGFAVFVPNARGSTGYGLAYAKQVDRDWGGRDRLDHVHALKVLGEDTRVDTSRAGVVGRSYGGYMSLTLAARHPELWSAAVDMFGPYDLLTFSERIPETWKPYFYLSIGDLRIPEQRADLIDRSPKTHIGRITCPLLVIQGKNDPRVVEQESRDLVDYLRSMSRPVDYLMFENEGHDVLKMENRVRCYNAITDFFRLTLKP
jgi:dipeptidyl aminopeptidase/acylaminoacyl peptidase